jgi:hypothetical protein
LKKISPVIPKVKVKAATGADLGSIRNDVLSVETVQGSSAIPTEQLHKIYRTFQYAANEVRIWTRCLLPNPGQDVKQTEIFWTPTNSMELDVEGWIFVQN